MWCHCPGSEIYDLQRIARPTAHAPSVPFFFYYICLDFPVVLPLIHLLTKQIFSVVCLSLFGTGSTENESSGRVQFEAMPNHSLCNRY